MVENKSGIGPREMSEVAAKWYGKIPLDRQPLAGLEGEMTTHNPFGVSTERPQRSIASPNGATTPNGRHNPGK